eukprot:snap_masked-scaffold_50-processed-gene-0.14-mRNA-1 protein AED:1.00 eAED:1.00 QI:0/0/0/0/1/1/5/0/552
MSEKTSQALPWNIIAESLPIGEELNFLSLDLTKDNQIKFFNDGFLYIDADMQKLRLRKFEKFAEQLLEKTYPLGSYFHISGVPLHLMYLTKFNYTDVFVPGVEASIVEPAVSKFGRRIAWVFVDENGNHVVKSILRGKAFSKLFPNFEATRIFNLQFCGQQFLFAQAISFLEKRVFVRLDLERSSFCILGENVTYASVHDEITEDYLCKAIWYSQVRLYLFDRYVESDVGIEVYTQRMPSQRRDKSVVEVSTTSSISGLRLWPGNQLTWVLESNINNRLSFQLLSSGSLEPGFVDGDVLYTGGLEVVPGEEKDSRTLYSEFDGNVIVRSFYTSVLHGAIDGCILEFPNTELNWQSTFTYGSLVFTLGFVKNQSIQLMMLDLDKDRDGVLDYADLFPFHYGFVADSDVDGYPDNVDIIWSPVLGDDKLMYAIWLVFVLLCLFGHVFLKYAAKILHKKMAEREESGLDAALPTDVSRRRKDKKVTPMLSQVSISSFSKSASQIFNLDMLELRLEFVHKCYVIVDVFMLLSLFLSIFNCIFLLRLILSCSSFVGF